MSVDGFLESALRRDRLFVAGGLALVIVFSWIYVLSGAGVGMAAFEVTRMNLADPDPGMGPPAVWSLEYQALMFFMWWIMMTAMMLPSAAPMILLFALVNRRQRERGTPYVPTVVFGLAYLAVWGVFSLIAVVLQSGFQALAWVSPMLIGTNAVFGGALLLAAGAYQLTPAKRACLRHCRSPLMFITEHWRPGRAGAFLMGVEHGAYCAGCCWVLMGLLFFGGVMNLHWIAGLAVLVLLEKTAPFGNRAARATGVVLAAWGAWVLTAALM